MNPQVISRNKLVGILGVAGAAALVAFTGGKEGLSLKPYRDPVGVWTVCRGQTGVDMRVYSKDECDQMLEGSLGDYAQKVQGMTPGWDGLSLGTKSAVIDFAYNAGVGAYQKSSVLRRLVSGDTKGACEAILLYRFAGGRDCSRRDSGCWGVWQRRLEEREMCLR